MSVAGSITRQHAEWLNLVDASGPFLSLPVLVRAFPQGLDLVETERRARLRQAFEEWQDAAGPRARPEIHDAWFRFALREALGIETSDLRRGQDLPANLAVHDAGETLRPTAAIASDNQPPALLLELVPRGQDLDKSLAGRALKASPAERMRMLLRATGVRVGLVTNGEDWMLVDAPAGELTSYATFTADDLWFEEPLVLRAFASLLSLRRLIGVADDESLAALLAASARDQHEVTDQLGRQVRSAVEVLIQTIDRIDRDRQRKLLEGVDERRLYRAAVTVMMRLVFLFAAEERKLLVPHNDQLYQDHYAASTLRDQLEDLASRHGEEVLERRHDAWCRLLALTRAVHGGIAHENLRLPAYGGSLFDPDQYPFLEGRPSDPTGKTTWRDVPAAPLPIDNRTVLHLLRALQLLAVPLPGGVVETRRLSFHGLSVEQIGHVYEGLLDHTARRADGPVLGLRGAKGSDPEVPLGELERLAADPKALLEHLREATGRSPDALKKATGVRYTAPTDERRALLRACENDEALLLRVETWAPLLRRDTHQIPVVFLPGSLYVTQGAERRATGTHYTPPELTEPIVRHTLEPLCYLGPAEGLPREQWQLRPPAAILQLKVCDLAMGSGAFLAQACRYLAARLVAGWEAAERASGGRLIKTPEGELAEGDLGETLVPRDPIEREIYAKRIVADRCLFGVDKNPMAVEMAKLSLWLETLKKNAPFTFLDHALQPGDSLLGLTSAAQIEHFHIDPTRGTELYGKMFRDLYDQLGRAALDRAISKRRELENIPVREIHDIEHKQRLLNEANAALAELRTLADVIASAALHASRVQAGSKDQIRQSPTDPSDLVTHTFESPSLEGKLSLVLASLGAATGQGGTPEARTSLFTALRELVRLQIGHEPDGTPRAALHWPLAFPEVLLRDGFPGFDAIVGNPPFQGGQKITGALGTDYRDYLVTHLAAGRRGSADLCAYFFLRAAALVRTPGMIGLIATNTIAQGDSREVGLDQLTARSVEIVQAVASEPWPGEANLEVAHVWLRSGPWNGARTLNRVQVAAISSALSKPGKVAGKPYRLKANEGKSFIGSYVLGMGFVLTPEEARALIAKDPRNSDVLFPYLNGEDLNSTVDQSATRWVINFRDWPLDRKQAAVGYSGPVASDYPDCLKIVKELVKPLRDNNPRTARRERWWQYAERALELYSAISSFDRVLLRALTGKYNTFAFARSGCVYDQTTPVLVFRDDAHWALLNSSIHDIWALEFGSSLRADPRYTPSDCFETYAFPPNVATLENLGARYNASRSAVMQATQLGLTKTYNRFHDPKQQDPGIAKLRELHAEMDRAVAGAYGWSDLDLGHDFHETRQGLRFTVSEPARRELLDRLLALNHARYAEEVAAGLHRPGGGKIRAPAPKSTEPAANGPRSARKRQRRGGETLDLFQPAAPIALDLFAAAPAGPAAATPLPSPPTSSATTSPSAATTSPSATRPPMAPQKARSSTKPTSPEAAPLAMALLAALRAAGAPQTKAEILQATGILPERWSDIIDEVLLQGLVTKEGQARGTRYRLKSP